MTKVTSCLTFLSSPLPSPPLPSLVPPELHQLVEDGENLIEFYQLYETLPQDHMDLATRWTDWYQKTLLYRSVKW